MSDVTYINKIKDGTTGQIYDVQDIRIPVAENNKFLHVSSEGEIEWSIINLNNDYNTLANKPIINQDLDAIGFEPVEGTYYKHIGETDTYVAGVIYLFNDEEFKAIDGSGSGTGLNIITFDITHQQAYQMRQGGLEIEITEEQYNNIIDNLVNTIIDLCENDSDHGTSYTYSIYFSPITYGTTNNEPEFIVFMGEDADGGPTDLIMECYPDHDKYWIYVQESEASVDIDKISTSSGSVGQVLTVGNNGAEWANLPTNVDPGDISTTGGSQGQVLTIGNNGAEWGNIPTPPTVDSNIIIILDPQTEIGEEQVYISITEEEYETLIDDSKNVIIRLDYTEDNYHETLDLYRKFALYAADNGDPYEILYTTGKVYEIGEFAGTPADMGAGEDPRYVFMCRKLGATIYNDEISSDIKSDSSKVAADAGQVLTADGSGNTVWGSLKTINGNSINGSGNIAVKTYQPFPSSWTYTTTSYTTEQFCGQVNADPNAVAGMAYLGDVHFSDMPFNGNGDAVVEITHGSGTSGKVIHITVTSTNVSPYHWEYGYWNNHTAVGWVTFQTPLVSGTNIKTINNTSILGSGNLNIETIDDYNDLSNKPIINVSTSYIPFTNGSTIKASDKLHLDITKGAILKDILSTLTYDGNGMAEIASIDVNGDTEMLAAAIDLTYLSASGYALMFPQEGFDSFIYVSKNGTINVSGSYKYFYEGFQLRNTYLDADHNWSINDYFADLGIDSATLILNSAAVDIFTNNIISIGVDTEFVEGNYYLKPIQDTEYLTVGSHPTQLYVNTSAPTDFSSDTDWDETYTTYGVNISYIKAVDFIISDDETEKNVSLYKIFMTGDSLTYDQNVVAIIESNSNGRPKVATGPSVFESIDIMQRDNHIDWEESPINLTTIKKIDDSMDYVTFTVTAIHNAELANTYCSVRPAVTDGYFGRYENGIIKQILVDGDIDTSVPVVNFGGYVDINDWSSHLTITMDEFVKGAAVDIAFAKVKFSGDDGAHGIYAYLTKTQDSMYTPNVYGILAFQSVMDTTETPLLLKLDSHFQKISGQIVFSTNFNTKSLGGGSGVSSYDDLTDIPIINQTEESSAITTAIDTSVGFTTGDLLHFNTNADWDSFLANELTYTPSASGDYHILLQTNTFDKLYLQAVNINGTYVLDGWVNTTFIVLYTSDTVEIQGQTFQPGWQEGILDSNDNIELTFTDTITTYDNNEGGWNGNLIGLQTTVISYVPTPVDGKIYHRNDDLYKYITNTSTIKAIQLGDTISTGTKLHFNTTNDAELVTVLTKLIGSENRKCLVRLGMFNYSNGLGVENDGTAIKLIAYNSMVSTVLFASASGSGYSQGWQNLDSNNDYTFTNIQSGQSDVQTLYDYLPFEWNGVFVGFGETTTISKYNKFITDGEAFEVIDFSVFGSLDQYLISDELYTKLLNNDNIIIKFVKGGFSSPFYAYKANVEETNDGTNYWKTLTYACSYSNSGYVHTDFCISRSSSGYYGYAQDTGSLPSVDQYGSMYSADNYCQSISTDSGIHNIKEATYTYSNALTNGDIIDADNTDYELARALYFHYPVIVNGKRYEFQRKETNGSSQDVDTYMTSYLNGNLAHISIMQYNESTYEVTFKEQDVNGGVAYTTTAPSADNLDGDLKFVVLTSAQAQGITKYAGYLYYII